MKTKKLSIPQSWHNLRCIFVPIPKTGTTSIDRIIQKPHMPHPHPSILEIKKSLSEEKFNSYFKFSFVRNPWSLTVSVFLNRPYTKNRTWGHKCNNFLDFVKSYDCASNYCRFVFGVENQLTWITDKNNNLLVDFVGKFENLEKDFSIVAKKLNLKYSFPHVNKTKITNRKHYTKYYNDETIEIVYENFKKDIECFGYTFGK